MIPLLMYLLTAVLVVFCVYSRFCETGRLMAKIPGPIEMPLIGNILVLFRKTPEQIFNDLRSWPIRYGRLWKLNGASIRVIHLYHPEDVEIILSSTRYIQKDIPYNFLYGWLRQGLLVSNGDKWHTRRKMLTPAFHFTILNKFFKIFCEHTQVLLNTIENEVSKGKTDLIPLTTKVTLRIMCETSMGTKIHEDTLVIDNYLKAIHRLGACLVQRLISPWYFIDNVYMFSSISRREKSILPDLHNFTKKMIQERREYKNTNNAANFNDDIFDGMKNRPAMLDLLFEEEEKGKIDDNGIREEVDTFLFEGHDTTATALNFMIMRIANEPEIQNHIHEELKSIFGQSQRELTIDDLSKMKYLECCIKESLRLYPSVPFVSRYITEEVMMAGFRIPKNTYFDVHVFDIHRNPDVYPDPEKFKPEKFLPENIAKRHPYAYIPFSAGPRNCIGQKFAIMELKTLMSGIFRKFRLEPVSRPEDLVFISDIVLRTNHPIYVQFCRRENS